MHVLVTEISYTPGSTMGTATGTEINLGSDFDDVGRTITFGVDHRPLRDMAEALDSGEHENGLPCYVEDWQVLSIVRD